MRITIANRQTMCNLNAFAVKTLATFFAEKLQRLTPSIVLREVSLVIVDDAGIRPINQTQFGLCESTDVISCRYDPMAGDRGQHTGEIIVNVQRALAAISKRRGWSTAKEFALYVPHGCDHLSGEDDDTEAGYARMRRRELRWVKDAANAGILDRLVLSKKRMRRRKMRSRND